MAKPKKSRVPEPAFQRAQYEFAAHLRDPESNPPPPGIEERRMKIYRELFYNNVEDFLANAFPVLRKISADDVWHRRVRDFYARHESHDPLFHRVAEEFLRFLENERGTHEDDPPFIRELCHYEWVELALSVSALELTPELGGAETASCVSKGVREASHRPAPAPASLRSGTVSQADPNGDLLQGRPLVSPLAWTLAYDYPVQRIGPDFQPTEPGPQPTYLIVNRNRQDEVKFMEVNAVTARLMQLLEEDQTSSGQALLERVAAELSHPQPQAVVEAGAAILTDLRERDIVLGTRR
jgi:hypothetical protein